LCARIAYCPPIQHERDDAKDDVSHSLNDNTCFLQSISGKESGTMICVEFVVDVPFFCPVAAPAPPIACTVSAMTSSVEKTIT
jgi:hypothetical protein